MGGVAKNVALESLLVNTPVPVASSGVDNSAADSANPDHWSVFVLQNPAGRCFVGHTENLQQFLASADADVAKWTGQPGPWPLKWKHEGLSQSAARKYETSLKRDKNTPRFYTRTGITPPADDTTGANPNG